MVAQPHFLLFCDTHVSEPQHEGPRAAACAGGASGGRWHFVLEQLDGPDRLEAADNESTANRERLALLSVVRGLEALEQPSQVTLVTTSRYVSRGLRYGLSTWREADYMWERFGEQRPVRNSDLWRRVDTALRFHGVKCRLIQAGETAPAALAKPVVTTADSLLPQPISSSSDSARLAERSNAETRSGAAIAALIGSPATGQLRTKPLVRASTAAALPRHASYRRSASRPPAQLSRGGLWWSLAAAWIRWWRGRLQAKPSFYAT